MDDGFVHHLEGRPGESVEFKIQRDMETVAERRKEMSGGTDRFYYVRDMATLDVGDPDRFRPLGFDTNPDGFDGYNAVLEF